MRRKLALKDDNHCFACGRENPIGLKLSFEWDGGVLTASFTPLKAHQGYAGIVHGGIVATVLDECMAQAAIRKFGDMAATVEITVRFRKALMVGEETRAEATVEDGRHGLVQGRARLLCPGGDLIAEASSRMIRA
jgi:uncharacterized protein (TIGR00369 family)